MEVYRLARVSARCKYYLSAKLNHVIYLARNASTASESPYSDKKETHFGYETVSEKEKAEKVHNVFENVASNYDLMNDSMSLGVHRLWKDCFMMRLSPTPGTRLLDVAGGTGDIAFRFLKHLQFHERQSKVSKDFHNLEFSSPLVPESKIDSSSTERSSSEDTSSSESETSSSESDPEPPKVTATSHVVVCDINQAMLDVGKKRAESLGYSQGVSWLQGDAEQLPIKDNSFDAYTIAFGIRNVVHIDKALSEAYRILRPGGRFLCLEFSHVPNPLIQWMYDAYSFQVIPVLGQVIARDWKSYQYLVESIRLFPNQEKFKAMLEGAGFKMVNYENLTCGVAAIHSGFKI